MEGAFAEQMVVMEFAPGAGVLSHTHGGPTLVTVLNGEITLREDETETTYTAGESWTEMPGHVHEAFNADDAPVQVVVTFLLPVAAPTTLVEQ
jgi:quercetin dioxygenase-like cupin family protein